MELQWLNARIYHLSDTCYKSSDKHPGSVDDAAYPVYQSTNCIYALMPLTYRGTF